MPRPTRWVAALLFLVQLAAAWVPATTVHGRGQSALRPRRTNGGTGGALTPLVSKIKMAAGEADDSDDRADSDANPDADDADADADADVNADDVGSANTAGSLYAALNARLKTLESDGEKMRYTSTG